MKHYDVKIFGRVHGVNFRWATMAKARRLDLTGFVRNEPDGSVKVEVEGQEDDLETFLAWCHHGPLFAKVRNIEFVEGNLKSYNSFEIKYV